MIDGEIMRQARQHTPGAESLAFFNHAGASLTDDRVLAVIDEYLRAESLRGGYRVETERYADIEACYERLASYISARSDQIGLCGSASDGLCRILYSLDWQADDELLCSSQDYVDNYINYLQLQQRYGVILKIFNSPDGRVDIDHLRSLISNRTRLITAAHMPTNSGQLIDAEMLGAIAAEYELPYLLDACQTMGQYPIDVRRIGCDYLVASARKYLRGPRGLGAYYISDAGLKLLRPAFISSDTVQWIDPDRYTQQRTARMLQHFEKPYALIVGWSEALRQYLDLGPDAVWSAIQDRARELRERLSALSAVRLHDPEAPGGIIAWSVEGAYPEPMWDHLARLGIVVSISRRESSVLDMEQKGQTAYLRASVHWLTNEEDMDRLVEGIQSFN